MSRASSKNEITLSVRYALTVALAFCVGEAAAAHKLEQIWLPPGFEISLVSDAVPGARQMAMTSKGTLFVGSMRAGKVYALPDKNGDYRADDVVAIDKGLDLPSGVALYRDDLYVAALNRVLRYRAVESKLASPPKREVITKALPKKTHHGWKYLRFDTAGALYVPVGAPCNVCVSEDPRFASILKMDRATGATTVYAQGIRNSVGFAFHPDTGELWFTDNGRDMLGDDVPADELNRITAQAQHFGFPFVHAGDIADPELGRDKPPGSFVPPVVKIQAHSAALGMAFYTGKLFPKPYRNAIFIAEHGSWNRAKKVGYQVSVVRFENDVPVYEPFATGWLQDDAAWGRPNDVLMARDGSLLISDDQVGAIYRISYKAPERL